MIKVNINILESFMISLWEFFQLQSPVYKTGTHNSKANSISTFHENNKLNYVNILLTCIRIEIESLVYSHHQTLIIFFVWH